MTWLAVVSLVNLAWGVVPLPTYPDCGPDDPASCPNDLNDDDWSKISWIPVGSRATIRPEEVDLGSGIACDVAFRHTTGRFDVSVAILDSGILWNHGDLVNKVQLNTAELPKPRDASGVESATHDRDGNGLVNVQDYAEDNRVTVTSGEDSSDGRIDASDLLAAFSDGIDQDGNGYIDDIAGWDFFQDDNNPYSIPSGTYYDHGTGTARDALAEGGDGGTIGICPSCSMIPVRVGDVFVTDGDRLGLAIAYAADRGAAAIGMAVGGLTHSSLTDQAVAYAASRGVVLVAAAGDENSYHRNFPAVTDPILFVHSIRANTATEGDVAYSYLSFFNCNNYGPRLDLVAPSSACATGATANIVGAAGLLASAARDEGLTLSADEMRSLLRTSVDDIWLPAEDVEITRSYPSQEGWDAYYGYGRVNIGRAVERMVSGDLPPVARIRSPGWFEWVDADSVDIIGDVAAPRSTVVSWKLERGQGAEPSSWSVVAQGSGPAEGTLATLDLGDVPFQVFDDLFVETVTERMVRAHEPLVSLRLTVTDAAGRTTEDRRGIHVRNDPDLLNGFPFFLGGSGESSPKLADLDGDGIYEVIAATGSGVVHVLRGDGSAFPGFPVYTPVNTVVTGHAQAAAFTSGAVDANSRETVVATPAVGDIDGDGDVEIVVATYAGHVVAWHADGTPVAGFPVKTVGRTPEEAGESKSWDQGIVAPPVLANADGEGGAEIFVVGLDQRVYLWRGDGSLYPGYPFAVCHPSRCGTAGARIVSAPAVGDIDADGDLDAAFGSNEVPVGAAGVLYVVDLDRAAVWPGFPIKRQGLVNQTLLPVIGEGHPSGVSLADLDGDGRLEMASTAMLGVSSIIDASGEDALPILNVRDGFGPGTSVTYENSLLTLINNPAFGDMDLDGTPDLVVGGAGPFYLVSLALTRVQEYGHGVLGWSGASGDMLPGFPRAVDDVSFLNAAAIGDVSGDGRPEAIYATGGHFAYAWDADGVIAEGWPKFTGGWVLGGVSLGDVDGDGWLDAVMSTREGWLFAWRTDGRADQELAWASTRHDNANTGFVGTPIPVQAGPVAVEEGRGCCKGREDSDSAAIVLLVLPLALRRRRRG